ncbi:hypothetical protein [Carboxylicivirga sp. N1Y90]|uniref:hypothetical protein n=1 Tax=Carboxylicivirga fragile TaxID=3417571 RepID=UPI003D339152|nr:hypothetical protein [Marinilabiliaceae bacterium N1Y90]
MDIWITTKIVLDANSAELNRFHFKTFTMDSNGNTLDETEYDSESNIVFRRTYRYHDCGEVKEFVEYDPFDELLERHVYNKNSSGEFDRHEFEFSDGGKSIKEFSFTDIGNAEKATIIDENGAITGYEVYILNDQGQTIEEIELDADSNEISRYEKTYFKDGQLKHEKQFQNGKLFKGEAFEYDSQGNVIKKIHRNYVYKFEVIEENTFDNRNNIIHSLSHENGELVFENKCGYDDNDNLISEEFFEFDLLERRIVKHERLIHELKH